MPRNTSTTANASMEERLKDFGDHLESLKTHQRRLAALCHPRHKSTGRGAGPPVAVPLTETDLAEMEGEVLIVEQMAASMGWSFLGLEPSPDSGIPIPAHIPPCIFSIVERRSDVGFRKLQTAYQQLSTTCKGTVEKAKGILAVGGTGNKSQQAALAAGAGGGARLASVSPQSAGGASAGGVEKDGARRPTQIQDCRTEAPQGGGQQQQQQLVSQEGSGLLVQDSGLEEALEREKREEIQAIAREAQELRAIREEMDLLVGEQGEGLQHVEDNADEANTRVEKGRNQLLSASKMKVAGAWIGGAVVGGLVGGPVGMLAGAKSAGVIVACAVGGAAVTGGGTKVISDQVHKHNSDFEELPKEDPASAGGGTSKSQPALRESTSAVAGGGGTTTHTPAPTEMTFITPSRSGPTTTATTTDRAPGSGPSPSQRKKSEPEKVVLI